MFIISINYIRLVPVPTSVLIWSDKDIFHLLNILMLSAAAIYIVITTQNAQIDIFSRNIHLASHVRGDSTHPDILLRLWGGLTLIKI